MKIGIVGFGHLGKALAKGLVKSGVVEEREIYVLAKSQRTKDIALKQYAATVVEDINEMLEQVEIIFWVIKGSQLPEVYSRLDRKMNDIVHISFMAGVTIEMIKNCLGNATILRAMPNIAIENADGIIGYTKTDSKMVVDILNKLGYAFEIEEKDIEKVTAFSACGLGFAAYILNAFQKTGMELGFSEEISEHIVAKTFSNAITMSNYEVTADSVATKGGATEQGILCFEDNNLNEIIKKAIYKAYDKVQ
ncbi:pyrroline-5-carboxylate reductase family protein [Anaerosporobacter sp.]|uniref:pyrroline-5-carboxylate reductase family protein n=1 Tax=Anaerosporobacter sp. TaxID=1872529 RepID=UPI00286F279F|nr:pyrroline-5-carboxylate reductase dimerization domain-containing protein [Anaerosporobacter sp.]